MIGKAESLADQKAARAADLNKQADAKDAEAKNAPDKPTADKLAGQAADLRADAKKAQAEADSLRTAVQNSGNQALVNDLPRRRRRPEQEQPGEVRRRPAVGRQAAGRHRRRAKREAARPGR